MKTHIKILIYLHFYLDRNELKLQLKAGHLNVNFEGVFKEIIGSRSSLLLTGFALKFFIKIVECIY